MPGGFVAVPLVSKSAISKVVPVRAAVRCAAIVGLSRISTSAPSNGDKWSHKRELVALAVTASFVEASQ